ncbi:MAG: uracil-DNA glycosylase family protein [Bacteroidota bacterium]
MFFHKHPYEPFLFPEAEKLIVGTLPPPRFSTGELKSDDVDFCYGSRNGMLWPILDEIFNIGLSYEITANATSQRKQFLLKHRIAVCDIVESAEREKVDASDLGMQNVKLRNIIGYLKEYRRIGTLLFMGGNSKNGPEYFFRKLAKTHNIELEIVSSDVPRIHQFKLPEEDRAIRTVSFTAPSGAANRAIGSIQKYKDIKRENPAYTTFDFRVEQYRPFFEESGR